MLSAALRHPSLLLLLVSLASAGTTRAQVVAPSSQPVSQPAIESTPPTAELEALKRRLDRAEQEVRALKEREAEREEPTPPSELPQEELDRPFSLYGFFDLNFTKFWIPGEVIAEDMMSQEPTFLFGNLNFYFDFHPSPSWRMLAEIRFLLNPLGDDETLENPMTGETYQRVNVVTRDVSEYGSQFEYGSIAVERAQLEWKRYELFSVTAGLFLTPFGIWNVDHGSPARVMVAPPFFYTSRVNTFPERQLGLLFSGSGFFADVQLAYDLYLTNGRGPAATLLDYDTDKAFGGRLKASAMGEWSWKAGLSFFSGLFTDYKRVLQLSPTFDIVTETTVKYREHALGADFQLDVGPLSFLAETIFNWRLYHDPYRPPASTMGNLDELAPDALSLGLYGVVAYNLPLQVVKLRPYVLASWVDQDDTKSDVGTIELGGGINWQITPSVVFKLEYHWWHSAFKPSSGRHTLFGNIGDLHTLFSQIAVAF